MAFVFGLLNKVGDGRTNEDKAVSEQMVTHWTNFGKTGNPNRQDKDALALLDRKRLSIRVINSDPATVEGVRKHILAILASCQLLWRNCLEVSNPVYESH